MKIGGEREPARLQAKHWRKFIQDVGVGEKAAVQRLATLTRRVRKAAQVMVEGRVTGSTLVGPVVLANCQRLLKMEAGSE